MSNTKRRKTSAPRTSRSRSGQAAQQKKKLPIIPILGIGLAAVLVVTIVLSFGSSEDRPLEVGAPVVSGETLQTLADPGTDPTVGSPAPQVSGADWNGNLTAITPDGRAKMVIFLAHWCGFCQDEVPVVQDWLDNTTLPPDVDVVTIATSIDEFRDNYPTSEWLEKEGWTPPVILDDAFGTVAASFGMSGTPFWVFIDADGSVTGRLSGPVGAASLDALAASLSRS